MADVAEKEVTSADVVAEAAEELKSGKTQESVKDFAGEGDDKPKEQEGSADEPADDAAEGGDYEPEEQAEYVDDDGEPIAAKPTSEPAEELSEAQQAALSGKTQAEIADALIATQEPAGEPSVTPTTPEPAIAPETPPGQPQGPEAQLQGAVQTLMREDPNVARRVEELGTLRDGLVTREELITKNNASIAELTTKINEGAAVLKYLDEQAKADPDDMVVADRARDWRSKVQDQKSERSDLKSETVAAKAEQRIDDTEYRGSLKEIRTLGEGVMNRGVQQAKDEETYKEHHADATTELNDAIPKLMKEWGFADDMKGHIEDEIGLWSQNASDEDLRAGNLENWIRTKVGPKILPKFEKFRAGALKTYADQKRGDAEQPSPEGAAAAATPRPSSERVLTSKEADRQAARSMRKALQPRQ